MKKTRDDIPWWGILLAILLLIGVIFFISIQEFKINNKQKQIRSLNNIPLASQKIENPSSPQQINDSYSAIVKRHWTHMPIEYFINKSCDKTIISKIEDGVSRIQNETKGYISFNKSRNPSSPLRYNCEEPIFRKGESPIKGASTYFISPVNQTIITGGIVTIFGQGNVCNTGYPVLEVHETLHVLDIDHTPLVDSIMAEEGPLTSRECKITKIDEGIISCLTYIYSNNTVPGKNCSYLENNWISSDNPCPNGWFQTDNDATFCCPLKGMNVSAEGFCIEPTAP